MNFWNGFSSCFFKTILSSKTIIAICIVAVVWGTTFLGIPATGLAFLR